MLGIVRWTDRQARHFCAVAVALGLALTSLVFPSHAGSKAFANSREEADAFFTNGTILRLQLEIPESGLISLRRDPRTYVAATLRDGNTTYSNIAVHLKGGSGSFRRLEDRPGFTVNFSYLEPDCPRFHGLKKIHLNNSVQDPSRVSELVCGQMFREAGVPAARAAHALLEFNGRRLGLYVVMESMTKDFFRQYFKNPEGNLYGQTRKCDVNDPMERMEGDGPETREDLKALAAAVQETNVARRVEQMEKTLDVERFLSFMALETILCHWDGYTMARHNFRIYQDVDTGRMVFIPHDLDQLMVRANVGFIPRTYGMVAAAVVNTPELRTRYLQRVCSLSTNLFLVPRWTNRVDQAMAAVLPTVQDYDPETARFFSIYANAFKTRIVNRDLQLKRQMTVLNGTAKPLAFTNDIVLLREWWSEGGRAVTRLERTKDQDGTLALWINTTGPAQASWRCQVLLAPGRYRLEGRVRCAGVETPPRRKAGGAGLTASGLRRSDSSVLTGDSPWQKLTCEFEVITTEDVDLGCELRAQRGEVWFDSDSLVLVRLK